MKIKHGDTPFTCDGSLRVSYLVTEKEIERVEGENARLKKEAEELRCCGNCEYDVFEYGEQVCLNDWEKHPCSGHKGHIYYLRQWQQKTESEGSDDR